jgi:hypothetical protein
MGRARLDLRVEPGFLCGTLGGMSARHGTQARGGRRRLERPSGPAGRARPVPSPVAAAAVGLLVAVLARVLVLAGERVCDVVRGTASCGGTGGFMLLVIAGVMIWLGTRLLRMLGVPHPGVTSLLGVALLAIALLTVLLDHVFSLWMWVVLPLLAAVLYAFAAWAATRLAAAGGS